MNRLSPRPSPACMRLPVATIWLGLLMLVCLLAGPARAGSALELARLPEQAAIGQWLDVTSSADDSLLPGELISNGNNTDWRPNGRNSLAIGLSSRAWWLRLRVHNAGSGQLRVLQLSRATLGSVGLYSRAPNGSWTWRETGAQAQSPRGDVEAPGYAFKLWLPPGNSEHLIRLRSSYALNSPILLSSQNAILRQAQDSAGWYGWALGALSGMLGALLLLRPAHVSRRLAISYSAIQAALIFYALADRGVLGSWWLALPGVQHGLLQLSVLLLQMSFVWFTLVFLHERKSLSERWHTTLLVVLGLQAIVLMLSVVIARYEVVAVMTLLPVISALLVTAACVVPMRNRVAGATLLFIASLALLLSRLLLALSMTPVLPLTMEPYQWLLGFHVLHSGLLLRALHQHEYGRKTTANGNGKPKSATGALVPAAKATRPGSVAAELRLPLRVLVVEDNTWVQQVLVGLLRKLGVDTVTAVTGMQALTLLEQETLDLVLMDCDLPELDGLSATQVWRQRERELKRQPLPILAVTAHVSELQRQQALDAGMNDFLAKPVDMRTLREAIINWTSPATTQAADKGPRDVT